MTCDVLFDTNVLIYTYDPQAGEIQRLALEFMNYWLPRKRAAISVQVLSEFVPTDSICGARSCPGYAGIPAFLLGCSDLGCGPSQSSPSSSYRGSPGPKLYRRGPLRESLFIGQFLEDNNLDAESEAQVEWTWASLMQNRSRLWERFRAQKGEYGIEIWKRGGSDALSPFSGLTYR